ncbi:MAG TPA: hypothetical protein VKV26_13260 [Dehalococcoidia bacterium]|nr:hypothetical protein [Dehalococcoidia bacterium]
MRRTRTLVAGLATLLLGLGALACTPARADMDPGAQAYYVVVLPADAGSGNSSNTMQIVQVNGDSNTQVQINGGTATVGCTRYSSYDDASAAASLAHADANWSVVLAPDALHAVLAASGVSPDVASWMPALADADICTPDAG